MIMYRSRIHEQNPHRKVALLSGEFNLDGFVDTEARPSLIRGD